MVPVSPRVLLSLAALTIIPSPARALSTIDDFEVGQFNQQTTSLSTSVQWVQNPVHLMSEYRTTILSSTSGENVHASLSTSHVSDDEAEIQHLATSAFACKYEFEDATDLTDGGFYTRVLVDVEVENVEGSNPWVRLYLWGEDFAYESVQKSNVSTGTLSFALSQFTSVDPTKIRWMQVQSGSYQSDAFVRLDHIRRARHSWVAVWDLAILWQIVVQWDLTYIGGGGEPSRRTGLQLVAADVPFEELRFEARGRDQGRAASGEIAQVDLWGAGIAQLPTTTTWQYELRFDEIAEPVELAGTPRVVLADKSAAVEYELGYPGSPGEDSREWLTFDLPADQPLRFLSVEAEPLPGDAEQGLLVSLKVAADRELDPGQPLIMTDLQGDRGTAGGTTPAPERTDLRAGDSLTAAPSVARQGTSFRLQRPPTRATTLEIFDVQGRRIRSLGWPSGAPEVQWDVRDASGRTVAPGVYWARAATERNPVTRVVVVR